MFCADIATNHATEASFQARVGEVVRHKAVFANVLGAKEIKSVFQRLLLKLITMGQPINWCVISLLQGRADGEVGRPRGWLVSELRSSGGYWIVLCNVSKDGVCGSTSL